MLIAEHLVKRFAGVVAVDDVSLRVRPGAVFGLLGPNGAGKTTTIRMLLNIITPDSGTITLNGAPVSEATKNRMGYLPEERGLYRKGIVLETILYFAALKNVAPQTAKPLALKWLERFDLAGSAKKKVEELSKGNQQKVQFIISILHDPDILVLDEPFSGLDPVNQEVLKEIIIEQRNANKGIIFSTHQMEQAEKLCDDIALINHGKAVIQGTLDEARRTYGKNTLRLEFKGDGTFLSQLPGVEHVTQFGTTAELRLNESADVNSIIKAVVDRVELRSAITVEPSLHAIFLEVVGAPPAAPLP